MQINNETLRVLDENKVYDELFTIRTHEMREGIRCQVEPYKLQIKSIKNKTVKYLKRRETELDIEAGDDLGLGMDTETQEMTEDDDMYLGMGEEMNMDTLPSLDFEQQTIEVSPDDIKTELHSTIDQVLSKYFAPSEEEQQMFEQKEIKKFLNNKVKSSVMKNQVKQLSESIEQEMTAEFILRENNNVKFLGKTNKHNLVFETDNVQLKVTTKGEIL